MNIITFFTLCSLVLLTSAVLQAGELKQEDPRALVEAALANNPEISASAFHQQMLEHRARQAGSLEDPMLMLKLQNGVIRDPLNFRRDGMTQKVAGISQQLPWYGKRDLRGKVARLDAEASHLMRQERILEIIRSVKETCYQLFLIDKSLEIITKNTRIMDDFIVLAETRYMAGQGAQQDIFKAQLEKSKLLDMRITLEQQRRSHEIRLNSLLYRPLDTPVGTIPEPRMVPHALADAVLMEQAEKKRPLLKSMQAQIGKSKAAQTLARREFYPDFNLSFEYMQRDPAMGSDGSDMYSLGLTFNLPLQRERRHAMLAEAASEQSMASAELNDARNSIRSAIADLLSQMERRRKLVELYKGGIIPQAEQALESAVIAYRVGKVDFPALLDSQSTLFNYEREFFDSLADYQMRLAQLEATVGGDVTESHEQ